MNLILFDAEEIGRPLAADDVRAKHLLAVLRRRPGDTFDAGIVDGPRGKGTLLKAGPAGIEWSFGSESPSPDFDPITLIAGLPRPQTARKILSEAAALGVRAMRFVATDKGEPSYRSSTLWTTGEWRRHVRAGVEQAFATRIPEVVWGLSLAEALDGAGSGTALIALDNYEASASLATVSLSAQVALAIGSERGWSAPERGLLRERGAALAGLGRRVLRTETACVAALAIVRARMGLF
ncbi:MAG: RsmE family RNA methyltransferase [Opitutaceae bacterium]